MAIISPFKKCLAPSIEQISIPLTEKYFEPSSIEIGPSGSGGNYVKNVNIISLSRYYLPWEKEQSPSFERNWIP